MPCPDRAPFYVLTDLHGDLIAEFRQYPEQDLLHLCWHGHLTADVVVRVAQLELDQQVHRRYRRVLNDKSDTSGDWHEALPWLQYEWLPQATSAGLHALSYVFSPDLTQQFASLDFAADMHPQLTVELFQDQDLAWQWLLTQ